MNRITLREHLKTLRGDGSNQYGHKGDGSTGGRMPFESAAQRRSSLPTGKDEKRISDIITKSNGSMGKAHDLAHQMANAITDPMKASRRGRAADSLGHSSIATIFHDRHRRLIGRAAHANDTDAVFKTLRQFEEGDAVEITLSDDENEGEIGIVTACDDGEYDVENADGEDLGTYLESELRAASLKALAFQEGDDVIVKATGELGTITSVDDGEYDVENEDGEDLGTFTRSELRAAQAKTEVKTLVGSMTRAAIRDAIRTLGVAK